MTYGTLAEVADTYEIHNESGGPAGSPVQIGVINGDARVIGWPNASDLDEEQEKLRGFLVGAVHEASDRELERWGLRGTDALPVRWHTAAEDLHDHWKKIQRDGAPVPLEGHFTAIRRTYEAIETKRLVVLGRAGAGKTVLAHRLILDLLKNRHATAPVPVLFSLGDWNPATELRTWLADHLTRDFPFLDSRDAAGRKHAQVFLNRGLIVPVLDGFDELPEQHHRAAIGQISSLDLPLILTSRPAEYTAAAREIKAVGGAAAIFLEDLTLEKAHEYLRSSTSKVRAPTWDSVFEQLRAAPGEHGNLAAVLTSPLMVVLARTAYNDRRGNHPGELLDAQRFPTGEALEDHLLASYLDTTYSDSRDPRRPNWNPDQARRWLGHLAEHLHRLDTHDLAWWRLPATLCRATRVLVITAACGLSFGIVYLALAVQDSSGLGYLLTNALIGLITGLIVGLVAATTNEARLFTDTPEPRPERLHLKIRRQRWPQPQFGRLGERAAEFANGTLIGFSGLLSWSFAFTFVSGLQAGLFSDAAVTAVVELPRSLGLTGLVVTLMIGLSNVAVSILGDSYDPAPSSPWRLLARDRAVTLVRTAATCTLGLVLIASLSQGSLQARIGLGIIIGVVLGLVRLTFSAWGNWLLFARLWLPLTGRLPWRPKRFLEDAHDRGVLRRTGAVYQFRHARLRGHLAERHRNRRS